MTFYLPPKDFFFVLKLYVHNTWCDVLSLQLHLRVDSSIVKKKEEEFDVIL